MSDATGTLDPGGEPASNAWPDLGSGYKITGCLGVGGMGTVYRARDLRLERDVAIKVLSTHFHNRPDVRLRFLREARTLAVCNHPNVIQVHTCSDPEAAIPFLVMELVDGSTLQDVLDRQGPPSWNVAIAVVLQLLEGLAVVHARGVIHRDIKPGNVLIHDGAPKLADFGVAHIAESTALTVEGRIVGTVRYLPPEAFNGVPTAIPLDVYAMGCLLYELLVGHAAFPQPTTAETMAAICRSEYVPPERSRPELPASVVGIVEKSLSAAPELRFESAASMAAACRAVLEEAGADPGPQAVRSYFAQTRSRGSSAATTATTGVAAATPAASRTPRPSSRGATLGGAGPVVRGVETVHGLISLVLGLVLIGPVFTGYDPEGGSAVPASACLIVYALLVLWSRSGSGRRAATGVVAGAVVGAVIVLGLMRSDLRVLAEGTGDLARWSAGVASVFAASAAGVVFCLSWRLRTDARPFSHLGAFVAAGSVMAASLGVDAWRAAQLAAQVRAAAAKLPPTARSDAQFSRHEGLVLVAEGRTPRRGSWLGLLRAGLDPIEPIVKAPLPARVTTAFHLAAADADCLASLPPTGWATASLSIYDAGTLSRIDDLARRTARAGGATMLEAPSELVESEPKLFFQAHTALMLALARRVSLKVAVLPAMTACTFLRGPKPRATRAELLEYLRHEATVIKENVPTIEIGIQEAADPDESLLEELAPQRWLDWVIVRPIPGTVPVSLLDETYRDLEVLGVSSKMALQTYMPFGTSQYWPWHEDHHGGMVALAARYVAVRRLKGWIHAPIWSHREYGFRVADRTPPLRPTAARAALDDFLIR